MSRLIGMNEVLKQLGSLS